MFELRQKLSPKSCQTWLVQAREERRWNRQEVLIKAGCAWRKPTPGCALTMWLRHHSWRPERLGCWQCKTASTSGICTPVSAASWTRFRACQARIHRQLAGCPSITL